MIPDKTIIKVDVGGMFSMPRGITRSPAISFNPNVNENFNTFRVLASGRSGGRSFGILSMINTKGLIYEISVDPTTYFHHKSRRPTGGADKKKHKKKTSVVNKGVKR